MLQTFYTLSTMFVYFIFSKMSKHHRPLFEKELLEIVESDELWVDFEEAEQNRTDDPLPESDKLNACVSILDCSDESDQDEDDEELYTDHCPDSEEEWKPRVMKNLRVRNKPKLMVSMT